MFKKVFPIGLLVTSLFTANTYAGVQYDESPFELDVDIKEMLVNGQYQYKHVYTIISLTDNLIVNNIILNRGHCRIQIDKRQVNQNGISPVLNYSNTWKFYSKTDEDFLECSPLEIEIETNQGDYIFD